MRVINANQLWEHGQLKNMYTTEENQENLTPRILKLIIYLQRQVSYDPFFFHIRIL